MQRHSLLILACSVVVLVAAGGWYLHSAGADKAAAPMPASANGVIQDDSGKTVLFWYDPMVPTQKFDKPGKSPFMDMMLEPKYAEADGQDSGVSIPSSTVQNLGIRTAMVEMQAFGDQLAAVGRIEPDERRFYTVQPRMPGFVEKLMVRAIGDPVKKGQKIAEIYAPELLAAQQEYLALLDYDGVAVTAGLAQAARQRLKLLGMSEEEVSAITRSRQATQRFGIYAPASGVLTELGVREGGQLMAGAALVQIADLSAVWLIAEVPERDVMRLRIGTEAQVELQSLPGEQFKGKVNYLYPSLDETARTVRVRIELANRGGLLRTGMYGNVMLAGASREALSVPSESVIATGTRKVVIKRQDDRFIPVEVVTGEERDGHTEIITGLQSGEAVVASGQFLIDSEASLSGVLARLAQPGVAAVEESAAGQPVVGKPAMGKPAEQPAMGEHAGHAIAGTQTQQKMPMAYGKVIDVDAGSGKVTLAHEPIEALGWPSMTMGFKVPKAAQLSGIKAGDQVEFTLKSDPQTEQYAIDDIRRKAGSK